MPSHDRQACFDALSECLRGNVEAVNELWKEDRRLSSEALSALRSGHGLHADSISTDGKERPKSVLASAGSSLLLRLACDNMTDSTMFWRALFTCEDWCYGLTRVASALGLRQTPCPVLPSVGASLTRGRGSWEALVGESVAIVSGVSSLPVPLTELYDAVDNLSLSQPIMQFLRCFRIPLLFEMMRVVTIDNVGHDNLCNLNTALLLFMSAHRHGALPALVMQLREHQRCLASSAASADPIPMNCLPSLKEPVMSMGWSDIGLLSTSVSPPLSASVKVRQSGSGTSDATSGASEVPDVLLNFCHLLVFWLEYNSLRERDRRGMRSMSQYTYSECRVVVRALLGLPVSQPPTSARVHLGVLGEPPTRFFGLDEATAGRGYPPMSAAGLASAERLRQTCAEFDSFASQAVPSSAAISSEWLSPPPRFIQETMAAAQAVGALSKEAACATYWQKSCLLPFW